MIKEAGIDDSKRVNGYTITEFDFFRNSAKAGGKHVVGMSEEITDFVGFIKDAVQGGTAGEMAFVMVGEPGNGKTFFFEFICEKYREWLKIPKNRKYTFRFTGLQMLGSYGKIDFIESQTYEDPMILLMNLSEDTGTNKDYLEEIGFRPEQIDALWKNYRPLGACSAYIWNNIQEYNNGNLEKSISQIKLVPVPMSESLGTVTGKYPAKDKITSSSVDLLGDESIQRLLHITDTNNPIRFDLRRGALARVACGGIHFADELFKNKKDLVQVYLGVIQNRTIEIDGFKWPLDTLIIATSNNNEYYRFVQEKEEAPIIDRCRVSLVKHNTNYLLQEELTNYALGDEDKKTFREEALHQDPNLNYALSVAVVLTRLPVSEKLTRIETLKLAAGESAGEKSVKILRGLIEELDRDINISNRFGQSGIGQRDLGRVVQQLSQTDESNRTKCIFALDAFKFLEKVIRDSVADKKQLENYMEAIMVAKKLYRDRLQVAIYNAYRDQTDAVRHDVMRYVNSIIALGSDDLGADDIWRIRNIDTGELEPFKIDRSFVNAVDENLNVKTEEQRKTFHDRISKTYASRVTSQEKEYDFMDNERLVKAVVEVTTNSDVAGASNLIGALANRINKENQALYDRMLKTMINDLGFCETCARKSLEYYPQPKDKS